MVNDNLDGKLEDAKIMIDGKIKKVQTCKDDISINPYPLTERFHTQEEYIKMCNTSGLVLASCSDYYNASKYCSGTGIKLLPAYLKKNQYSEIRNWNERQRQVLRILTGDVVEYSPASFDGKIIKKYASKIEKQKESSNVIPVYLADIKTVYNSVIGLKFLQNIFDTEDENKELYKNLRNMFRENISEVFIATPQLRFRHARESLVFEAYCVNSDNIGIRIYTKNFTSDLTGRAYCLDTNQNTSGTVSK